MLKRQVIARAGIGLVGAAVLAIGGAGFLTAGNAASTSPACTGGSTAASAGVRSDQGATSGRADGSAAANASTPGSGSGSGAGSGPAGAPALPSGPAGIPVSGTSAVPTAGATDALAQFLATLDHALSSTPLGAAVPDVANAGSGELFVGASSASSRTGATVTPDPSGTGSHVGVVGLPGASGSLTHIGL
jgi:hypothetical protein